MPDRAARAAAVALGARSDLILNGILAISSEAIITVDCRSRISSFSAGAERIFGYAAAEVVGQRIEMLMPVRFREQHSSHVDHFAAGAAPSMLMQERQPIFGLRKSGEEFPIEASISKVETSEGVIFTTIVRDVSERRRADAQLRRSERRLRVAMQNSELHVFEIDYQAQTLSSTGAEGDFFDAPLSFAALAADPLAFVDARDRARVARAWALYDSASGPFQIECRTARSDDRDVWVALSLELETDANGGWRRMIGALQNITKRRQAEIAREVALRAAEAANNAKTAFLATMSHEIRTPLNGVLGMAQAMSFGELPPEQKQRLDIIRQSGESLLTILNDILDISKIEAGRLDIERVDFDLEQLIVSANAAFSSIASEKGVRLVVDAQAARGRFAGDPTRIRQILYNLVSNALKFTQRGEVRVTAKFSDGRLSLEVADTGLGMTPEVLEAIFRPFTQADTSTTREFGGTGLGLTICRRLAELMGGDICVQSEAGRGSVFTLDVPITRLGDSRAASRSANDEPRPPVERAVRVLAAEDNPTNQLVLKTLLAQAGLEVVMVENGAMATEAWAHESFDLILMDVQMPVMDGPTASRAIRAAEAASGRSRTPIIALTANAMAHQAAGYASAGMDATVTKPIDVSQLFEAIEAVLNPAAGEAGRQRAG